MDSTSRNKASCSGGKTGCCEELTGSGFSCSGTACLDVGDGCAVVGQKEAAFYQLRALAWECGRRRCRNSYEHRCCRPHGTLSSLSSAPRDCRPGLPYAAPLTL